jgi:hypothetical protein
MRRVRIAFFASLAACSASVAWAQYGLYGSPETLRLPQQEVTQAYAAPATYPATASPMPSPTYYPQQQYPPQPYPQQQPQYGNPAPAAATARYQPYQVQYPQPPAMGSYQSQQSYQPAPQYRYPAQPATTAAYQPYQSAAQYRYPGPATRPPVRTAAVEQPALQPIPAPPGAPATPAPSDASAPQGSGMMNQILTEQGSGDCYSDNNCGGAYRGAVGRFEQSACGPQADACGYDGSYCPWYASVSALVMGRSDGRGFWTSYKTNDLKEQGGWSLMPMSWKWGGEARFGRRFCCGCTPYALEASYWTTEALTGYRSTTYPGDTVNTVLNVNNITFNPPGIGATPANTWFQGAGEQTLSRRDEYHNVEVNLVREQLAWACDSPWDIGWSVGIRYFRFQESLVYDSIMPGHTAGGIFDAYLSDNVTNNLVGAQFGFDAAYNVCNGLRVFITPKVGVYNNYLDSTFQAQLGNHLTNGISTPYGVAYPVHATRNVVSFLTQIDLGADYQFTRNWSLRGGYRVLAATGIGFADDQFPQAICDIPQLQNAQNPSSLVLHGAFFGLTYNF